VNKYREHRDKAIALNKAAGHIKDSLSHLLIAIDSANGYTAGLIMELNRIADQLEDASRHAQKLSDHHQDIAYDVQEQGGENEPSNQTAVD
jgi:hypothetical protein